MPFRRTLLSASLLVTTAAVLWGCAGRVTDPASPWFSPPVDTTVILRKPLTVEGGRTRVFLQGGQQVNGVNQLEPSCNFELFAIADHPRTIQPDRFRIARVWRMVEEIVMAPKHPKEGLVKVGLDDDQTDIMHVVHFQFRKEGQPDVLRLTCRGGLEEPWKAYPPSWVEVGAAVGDYVNFEIPQVTAGL